MKKFILFIIFTFTGLILNNAQTFANEKIQIGLVVPLSGEYKEIGNQLGFKHFESSALVRSSYRARKHVN